MLTWPGLRVMPTFTLGRSLRRRFVGDRLRLLKDPVLFWVKTMQVIPAIDLRGGRCVRLRQGDFDQETVFGDDPAAMAARWEAAGAARIHLVDLDGAKTGRPVNVEAVKRIVETGQGSLSARRGAARRGHHCDVAGRGLGSGCRRHSGGTRPGLVRPDGDGLSGPADPGARRTGRSGRHSGVARRLERAGTDASQAVRLRCRWPASFTPISRVTARSKGPTCRQ